MTEETKQAPLKVLMLPSWYLPEGGQFCRNQAQVLCEMGIQADVLANVTISIRKYGFLNALSFIQRPRFVSEDGLTVMRNYHISFPFFKKLDGLWWSWKTFRLFKKYCKRKGEPDIIHVHSVLWGGYAAYLIKKRMGIPYIITEHKGIFGMSCNYAKESFIQWQQPFMDKAFSNASNIIAVSDMQIPKIQTFLTKQVPCVVVSNVIDTDFFCYKERIRNPNIIRCVCVNGFSYVKGYDVLFPAFDKVCDVIPNIQLTIVGEDFEGKQFEKLWQTVRHKDQFTFKGELDAFGVRDALENADFYILSSRVEGEPVSTLEALSTGLPVVCTEVVPHYVCDESNSIRVAVEDIDQLANGIIQMAADFPKYDAKQISLRLKEVAGKETVVRQLLQIYDEIIEKK